MFRIACLLFSVSLLAPLAAAQDYYYPQYPAGGDFYGPASVGSSEPLSLTWAARLNADSTRSPT